MEPHWSELHTAVTVVTAVDWTRGSPRQLLSCQGQTKDDESRERAREREREKKGREAAAPVMLRRSGVAQDPTAAAQTTGTQTCG